MLEATGHPFIDVGLATLAAYAGKRRIADLTVDDLDRYAYPLHNHRSARGY